MTSISITAPAKGCAPAGLLLMAVLGGMAHAQAFKVNLDIPNNSLVGVTSQQTIAGMTGTVASVAVSLMFEARDGEPMFNGDLYVTLSHDSGYAVLLNRVGRRDGFSAGYGDSGLNIILSDGAAADVHNYRLTLNGSHTVPLSLTDEPAALAGTWQPDGRNVDPFLVGISSARAAMLGSFFGLDPNGLWTLHVADVSGGGATTLREWGLVITAAPVPEAGETVVMTAVALGLFGVWHRRRKRG